MWTFKDSNNLFQISNPCWAKLNNVTKLFGWYFNLQKRFGDEPNFFPFEKKKVASQLKAKNSGQKVALLKLLLYQDPKRTKYRTISSWASAYPSYHIARVLTAGGQAVPLLEVQGNVIPCILRRMPCHRWCWVPWEIDSLGDVVILWCDTWLDSPGEFEPNGIQRNPIFKSTQWRRNRGMKYHLENLCRNAVQTDNIFWWPLYRDGRRFVNFVDLEIG